MATEASPLRRVELLLDVLNKAKTQWYHFTAVLVAGSGFFTDAYDLIVISTVTNLLGRLYYDPAASEPGVLPQKMLGAINSMALCGTVLGTLFFGVMGDRFGRRKAYGITLLTMIACSIGNALSFGRTANSVMMTLCFFRFWLGFGIGGDYPLSAIIMSEYSSVTSRGSFLAAVFAMQGFGILSGAAVSMIVAAAFNNAYPRPKFADDHSGSTATQADFVWRIILIIGAFPALLTLYFRLRLPESARYTALVEGDILKATEEMKIVLNSQDFNGLVDSETPVSSWKQGKRGPSLREFMRTYGLQLLSTCSTWFLMDITFYSQNLLLPQVLLDVGWLHKPSDLNAIFQVFRISRAQALMALCATVPGYWVSVFFIDKLGRRKIQMLGFFFMAIVTLVLARIYQALKAKLSNPEGKYEGYFHGAPADIFFLLYALLFFFANFGPNVTTFVIPAELFPTRLRSSCYGLSAACGKLGAIVGNFGFLYLKRKSYPKAFYLLAAANALGFIITYFLTPETKGKSLEELSKELEDGVMDEVINPSHSI